MKGECKVTLFKIRVELARTPDFPEGSVNHGYEIIAPLDKEGHIDAEGWRANRSKCTVHRFWGTDPEEHGLLRHTRGRNWIFDYDETTDEDDEPVFKLDRHSFTEGEYLSVTEHDGVQRTFRIASVKPIVVPL